MDLLVCSMPNHHVAGPRACFNYVKGAAGFFLVADNARGIACTMNGEDFVYDIRLIPFRNCITLGECAFTL
ncbi:hypothetical protein BDU57DRAFT_525108 [Ampelomyces quisqualis]|uniref:Uncharacterized protein n=1 Tax=Ampelomyces quisqualis TaxID=50730 RepID=A0A6A5Q5V2_AMPQU|nr:hypothetical protein BDU57DRAFT_525108 [Ampelomyces quisqualis]